MAKIKEMMIDSSEAQTPVEVRVGELLKAARQKRKRDLAKIADKLRIRAIYLEALENSEYERFPGQVYAIGFLKAYSDFLGLDTPTLLEQYKKETAFLTPAPLVMPIPEHQTFFPHPKAFLGGLFLILLVWVVWYFATYPATQEAVLPPIIEEEQSSEPVSIVVEENVVDEAVLTEEPASVAKPEAETTPVVKEEKPTRVQIVAKEDVWLEIQDEDTLVLNRVLKKGETYELPTDKNNMILKTGNAGGMDVFVDGQKVKSFGPMGAVRSNISLNPDKLKNR